VAVKSRSAWFGDGETKLGRMGARDVRWPIYDWLARLSADSAASTG
jgi:hypothetical protein